MSRRGKILLTLALAALLAAGIFGLRLYEESRPGNQNTDLNRMYGLSVRGIDNRQFNDLINGRTTAQQVREELGLTEWLERRPEEYAPGGKAPDVDGLSDRIVEEKKIEALNHCCAELFSCAVDLLEQMGQMRQTALEEWKSREESQRTTEHKILFGLGWLEKVYTVEAEADRTVLEVLDRYRSVLKQWGTDTEAIDAFWDTYNEQKTEIKAYFLDKYLG